MSIYDYDDEDEFDDDDDFDDEDDEFEDDDDIDDEDREDLNDDGIADEDNKEETEEDLNNQLAELDSQQQKLEEDLYNADPTDPDAQEKASDEYLKKSDEINKKRQQIEQKKGILSQKNKPKLKEMAKDAFSLGCVGGVKSKPCPHCKQKSLFNEPLFTKAWKTGAAYIIGKTRSPRVICLNPKCRSYYMRTGDTFINDGIMLIPKKNIFFIPKK